MQLRTRGTKYLGLAVVRKIILLNDSNFGVEKRVTLKKLKMT
jgi:hypothetical protein